MKVNETVLLVEINGFKNSLKSYLDLCKKVVLYFYRYKKILRKCNALSQRMLMLLGRFLLLCWAL